MQLDNRINIKKMNKQAYKITSSKEDISAAQSYFLSQTTNLKAIYIWKINPPISNRMKDYKFKNTKELFVFARARVCESSGGWRH